MRPRHRVALSVAALLVPAALVAGAETPADAEGTATVSVVSRAPSPVRVRVISDCAPGNDSATLYEGPIESRQTLRMPINTFCVCASSTSVGDPQGDYSPWMRYCGPIPRRGRAIQVTNLTIALDGH